MPKQGDINVYGFLSELLNYGQKRLDRSRAEEDAIRKAEAEQRKRAQELADWKMKTDYQEQQTREREQAKEIQKQRQAEIAKKLFGIVQEGEVDVPVKPVNPNDRLAMDAELPDYQPGASSPITEPSAKLGYGDYQQLIGEILPLDASLGNYAKQIATDRFKPEVRTEIVQANTIPGYEKYHKDWVVERKSTYDPVTGKTSYTYENPRRPATHKPSEYTTFVDAKSVNKDLPEGTMVRKTVRTDQYGDTSVDYTQPFSVSETDSEGKVNLTAPVKDFIKKTEINRISDIALRNYVGQNTKIYNVSFETEAEVPPELKPYIVRRGDEGVQVSYQGVQLMENGRVKEYMPDLSIPATPVDVINKQIGDRVKTEIEQYKSLIGTKDIAIVYDKAFNEAKKAVGKQTSSNKDEYLAKLVVNLNKEWTSGNISNQAMMLYRNLIMTEYGISSNDLNELIKYYGGKVE